ncbi:MAG TPA: amidohydrolase family protein [Stellaceae bacterium]|nr:amidohydrolase family protein [Stellaceae bacterium]
MDIASYRPVDCDVHIMPPSDMRFLLPYFDAYWHDHMTSRGAEKLALTLTSYPPNAPMTCRADWRAAGPLDVKALGRDALDPYNTRFAICHTLHSAQILYSEDMAAAVCRAMNDWISREYLDKDARLRAAIVVPAQSPELAAEEIERMAADRRFVEVQLLTLNEMPLGRRFYWPIYAAAEKHGLPIGIHAGSTYRHAPTPIGWPSHAVEDYIALSHSFQSQLLNIITEGVFQKFPTLKIVLVEAGFTWLPSFLWRADKGWRGLRRETPWLKESPARIIRDHVRFTLQPANAPPDPAMLERVIEQIDCDDVLLFSSDYPHWHYEANEVIPEGFPKQLLQKLLIDNPLATFTRLADARTQVPEMAQ